MSHAHSWEILLGDRVEICCVGNQFSLRPLVAASNELKRQNHEANLKENAELLVKFGTFYLNRTFADKNANLQNNLMEPFQEQCSGKV